MKQRLTEEITRRVNESDRPLDPTFPVVTKIVELALIGRSHPMTADPTGD
ncbi:hypothetical protein [Micromonospora tulbaghiae]